MALRGTSSWLQTMTYESHQPGPTFGQSAVPQERKTSPDGVPGLESACSPCPPIVMPEKQMHNQVPSQPSTPIRSADKEKGDTTFGEERSSSVAAAAAEPQGPEVDQNENLPHSQETPPCPSTSPPDVWEYGIPVPGSRQKKKIYPLAPVEFAGRTREECHEKFVFIRSELEAMVSEHLKDLDLQGIERRPVYSLRMAGPTPSTALPSIVVTCQRADVRRLQDLFRSRAETKLPVGKGPTRSPFLRALVGKQRGRHDYDPSPQVCFRLVYYGVQASTVFRKASRDIVEVYYPGDIKGLYCGGLVGYQHSSATLGLLIDVGLESAILIVDHLFSSMKPLENGGNQADCSGSHLSVKFKGSTYTDEEESESLFELLGDDDEYDELQEDAQRPDQTEVLSSTSKEPGKRTLHQFPQNCERLTPSGSLSPSAPYLDWALIKPSYGPLTGINTVDLPGKHHNGRDLMELTKVRKDPPRHLAGVYLVSGGRILSSSTFLPSFSGQESCEAWTVVLDDSNRLLDGECGSVVVDRETLEVYGHVVGSDDLGFPYVVPLSRVLDQIRTAFQTSAALVAYDVREDQRVGSTITTPSPPAQVFATGHQPGRWNDTGGKRTVSNPTNHIHFPPEKTPKEDRRKLVFPAHQQSSKRGKSWEPSRKTSDDWRGVTDAEERQRVRNKIAQRKFREKARERKALEQRDRLNKQWQKSSPSSLYPPYDPNPLPQDEGGYLSGLPWGGLNMRGIMAEGHATPGDQGSGLAPNESDSNSKSGASYLSPYGGYTNPAITTETTSATTSTITTTPGTSTGIVPASKTAGTGDFSHGYASPYSNTGSYWGYDDDYDEKEEKDGGGGGTKSVPYRL